MGDTEDRYLSKPNQYGLIINDDILVNSYEAIGNRIPCAEHGAEGIAGVLPV